MSQTSSNTVVDAETLTARQVLGLASVDGVDWARLHGHQYSLVSKRAVVRAMLHALAFALVAGVAIPTVNPLLVVAWGCALGLSVVHAFSLDKRLRNAEMRRFNQDDVRAHAMTSANKGAVWSLGVVALAALGAQEQLSSIWIILCFLVVCSTSSRYSVPLSTIAFLAAASVGPLIVALMHSSFLLAGVIALTMLLGSLGTFEMARMRVGGRLSELAMQEKSEVVSMLLREFEEGEADWLWQVDPNRKMRSVSPRLAFAIGKQISEIEGQPFLQLISGDSWKTGQFPPSLHELAEKLKRRESFSNLTVKAVINGERRYWELSGTPMLNDSGSFIGFRGVGSDVTEKHESSEKIAYLARYDTLTQLPNRLMLTEALGTALEYSQRWRSRCAFLMIDLDRFKAVNDSLGHLVGDQMLGEVARRLKPLVDEGEVCGRLGGDEFAIVVRDAADRKRIDTLAKTVIAALSAPYHIENQVLYVGASVGSAIGPRDGTKVEEIIRNADLALYRAKDEGGGVHCEYEPSLHATAEEKRQLEFSLRTALENDEMMLHFQPVVDANTEEVVSFEALVRWNSKVHGFVSPVKFIPIAEDTRLIVPIGTWVMNEACREAATNWPEHVKVNVNVSPEQLLEPDFAGTVVRALSHSGLSANRLEVEVTESIFMRDAGVVRKALEQCLALGCSVALDDFGTGYSSLGYLRKLEFTTIKVDRMFVQGAAQDSPESLAIIRAVVAMADSLGMTTTAEGVENQEEADLIRRLGCTKIQGYHFGRPMPAADARKIFSRGALKSA
ncbi:EAL domain-containing protein [Qipengyuania gaetbuli]|uniref:putative bifunctional diguanylate cyclase/phosphodiesterase n=1 Tax=Qipengyuania gaetbuli TaxID=266952 RepID=UPI001C9A2885|nr:EAL domain-containing protein [Qipengyuania gaetbuli]MBY6014405.1 EAL domain-containing protein [Qipengyuania gaetbuli]